MLDISFYFFIYKIGSEEAHRDIVYKNKALTIHKALNEPHFNEKTILVTNAWDYIDLWLKRNHKSEAQFFWQQAKHF